MTAYSTDSPFRQSFLRLTGDSLLPCLDIIDAISISDITARNNVSLVSNMLCELLPKTPLFNEVKTRQSCIQHNGLQFIHYSIHDIQPEPKVLFIIHSNNKLNTHVWMLQSLKNLNWSHLSVLLAASCISCGLFAEAKLQLTCGEFQMNDNIEAARPTGVANEPDEHKYSYFVSAHGYFVTILTR